MEVKRIGRNGSFSFINFPFSLQLLPSSSSSLSLRRKDSLGKMCEGVPIVVRAENYTDLLIKCGREL